MKKGDPFVIWPNVPIKAFVQLTNDEKQRLRRQQRLVLIWSILGSFTYAAIWYWFPTSDQFIVAQYGFGSLQIGILIATFGAAFIVTNFLWGYLNDLYWPYRIVTIGLIIAGISTFFFPYVQNFDEMVLIRVVEGVFNGAAWSGLVKTVQLWFPIEKRSKYLGIFIAIYSWAISVDFIAGAIVSFTLGWAAWAEIIGIIGIIVGILTFFLAKPYGPLVNLPHIDWGDVPPVKGLGFLNVSKGLFKYRWMVLSILAGLVVIGGANVISGFWIFQVAGFENFSIQQAELLGTVWGTVQGVLILIFGYLSDKTRKRVIYIKIGMGGGFISLLGVVLITIYHPVPVAFVWIVTIATGLPFLIAGPIFALLADRYGVQLVGAASGYFEGFGTGGGAFLLPLILGGLAPLYGLPAAWGVITFIVLIIFVVWIFQKEYTVGHSLVDVDTLRKEKELREKEFGLS